MRVSIAEYIWLEDQLPAPEFNSVSRFVITPKEARLSDFPSINYHGAAASGAVQFIVPVRVYPDPCRGDGHYLVLCEAYQSAGADQVTHCRAWLQRLLRRHADMSAPWFSFEQHYRMVYHYRARSDGNVTEMRELSRNLIAAHTEACKAVGTLIHGVSYNFAQGEGEFQIGYRGIESEECDALKVTDDLLLARYLLQRLCEQYNMSEVSDVVAECDYTDTNLFTCFSTRDMRDTNFGLRTVQRVVNQRRYDYAAEHSDYNHAMTGTGSYRVVASCSAINQISVRIPQPVLEQGYGYLEEQRSGHVNPYQIAIELLCAAQR